MAVDDLDLEAELQESAGRLASDTGGWIAELAPFGLDVPVDLRVSEGFVCEDLAPANFGGAEATEAPVRLCSLDVNVDKAESDDAGPSEFV